MLDDGDEDLAELLAEVRRVDVQSRHLVTDVMAGAYQSVFRGAGLEFHEVREYAEGDDRRTVDGSVTARMGRPFVRTYTEERERTVLFLFDLSASATGGFGIRSVRRTAARVCACLALSATRNGDKVGLVAFSDGVDLHVPPARSFPHALRIVRDCLARRGASPRTDPRPALELAARSVRRRAVVFLVSDFLAGDLEPALSLCARRHDVVAVRLLPPELAPPDGGLVRLRDPETGEDRVVDWGRAAVREAWRRRVAAFHERTERALRRAKVDCMDVPVPREPGEDLVAGPILRFFRMRELRGTKR